MNRPKGSGVLDRDTADLNMLVRVATLAASILRALRVDGRDEGYGSERGLRGMLTADGVQHSTNEVPVALALLEAAGLIERPEVVGRVPRPGWLSGAEPVAAAADAAEVVFDMPAAGTADAVSARGDDVPSGVADAARSLAFRVQLDGTKQMFELPRILRGLPLSVDLDAVVDYGVSQGWLERRGDRVLPGEVDPELVTSADRYGVEPAAEASVGVYW